MKLIAVIFTFLTGIAYYLFGPDDPDRFRHNIPCGLNVERSAFAVSDATGIGGPGDFFAIFAVFDLSAESVDAIEADGLAFLQGLECVTAAPRPRYRTRHYHSWQTTPAILESKSHRDPIFSVEQYLSLRDVELEIPSELLAQAQHSLSLPGSYVGEQSHGFLIVAPQKQRAYYIFAN